MANIPIQDQSEPASYKIPPQSLDAEEAILSAILLNNDALLDVLEILTPDDFYRSAHQKIFGAITALFQKNEPIDLITLSNTLRQRNQLDDIGGAAYLAQLVDNVPLAVNPQHYAKIVHDMARLRCLIEKSNDIAKHCFDNPEDVDGLVDYAESAIFEVAGAKLSPAFHHISELIEQNIDALEEREGNKALITGVPSGFSDLDHLTSGFQKSDLVIIAARPSMGKTALALNIARNAAVDAGVPTVIFSLEMSKEQLVQRMLCTEAKVDSFRIRSGFLSKDDWMQYTDAAGVITEAPIYIDDSPNITAMSIRAKARRLKREKDIGMIIIDYLQLMKGPVMAERRDLEISEISRSLKALAKELDLPVIALSQLNRKLEERSDKRPQLSDLRESGALEQDADLVAFIYRDEVYNKDELNPQKNKAEILLKKQRNGPTGDITLTYINTCTRFENYIEDPY